MLLKSRGSGEDTMAWNIHKKRNIFISRESQTDVSYLFKVSFIFILKFILEIQPSIT
jgi:hypothetical protein